MNNVDPESLCAPTRLNSTYDDVEPTIPSRYRDTCDFSNGGQAPTNRRFDDEVHFLEIPHDTSILAPSLPDEKSQHKERNTSFLCYCLDSGAARRVVGKYQYEALCREVGCRRKVVPSTTRFQFRKSKFSSTGKFVTRLKVANDTFIEFVVEVVNGDFPLLVGLEIMIQHELRLDFGAHTLSDTSEQWTLSIYYLKGHAFAEMKQIRSYSPVPKWRNFTTTSYTLQQGDCMLSCNSTTWKMQRQKWNKR